MHKEKIIKTLNDIIRVSISNTMSIIGGVVVGLLLPKLISISDYGYFKTFTLYDVYIGLFGIGIIDGIVLNYGNKNYDELDRKYFRTVQYIFFLIQCIFSLTIILIGIIVGVGEYKFIIPCIGVTVLTKNLTGFFMQLSQITQRFKEYSNRNLIKSAFLILNIVIMYILSALGYQVNYKTYLILLLSGHIILTAWYYNTYKDIVFGERYNFGDTLIEIRQLSVIGFPLLFANLCSTLILTIDRQFVNLLFDNETYAIYAFAYNMLSLVTVATSAIAVVLYPMMKRMNENRLSNSYETLVAVVLIFINFTLIGYYPLKIFIAWFLPKYTSSLPIFRIIFPGLALSSSITVVIHNYYKTFNKNFTFFKKSVFVLIISAIANVIAYSIYKTTASISIASIITMIIWYCITDHDCKKAFKINNYSNFLYIVFMMIVFYITSYFENVLIGAIAYIALYFIITFVIHRRTVNSIICMISNKEEVT